MGEQDGHQEGWLISNIQRFVHTYATIQALELVFLFALMNSTEKAPLLM